jgi:Transposase and inactivated derivatives, IS30 family
MNTHKYKQLSLEQRSQLQLLLKMGKSKKKIAEELGVHRSTVYRELKRNAKKDGGYSARYAKQLYHEGVFIEKRPSIVLENEGTGTWKWIL